MTEKRILVVDDEEQIRHLYQQAFTQAGYTVHTAASAEEALEITERTSFKLFILDLNLPGMNGVELCKEIRSHSPMAICIAVTGYASLFELHDCREAGFEDYFTKPVSLVELNEAVEQAFQKQERWKKR